MKEVPSSRLVPANSRRCQLFFPQLKPLPEPEPEPELESLGS